MRPRDVAGHGHVWMAEELKDLRIPVMMAATEVAIAAWRRKQDDLPGRSEAIRRLVELGLKAKAK
jgi:hypothetical protein